MQDRRAILTAAILVLLISTDCGLISFHQAANAVGVYEDVVGDAAFVSAPLARSLTSRFIRTNGISTDASIFALAVAYPLRSDLLIQFDQSFVTLSEPGYIKTGFGDMRLRARVHLWKSLRLMSAFRLGTGSVRLYPYSSQSVDLEFGLGSVDTLEMFHVWGSVTGTVVKRKPKHLVESQVHENYARFSGGILLPFSSGLALKTGVAALWFRSGGARELYSIGVDYAHSNSLLLSFAAQAEAGKTSERVSDSAVTASISVFY